MVWGLLRGIGMKVSVGVGGGGSCDILRYVGSLVVSSGCVSTVVDVELSSCSNALCLWK